ncbi:uncharacterized protein LOC111299104 [Durio zibethinus]|uniref:Uncharacterized protein LOC111299104 n=1 Tax=Durio zibethinus TaxID=66656 RepID=A0A6P5ZBI0_DURZI|nr:uncharacterized protein LOC111299104 [Durio zibethinus]
MRLRNSISNTKKFFQKTIQSFKSFFAGCEPYQKLPKTSPHNPFSFSNTAGVDMNPRTSNHQEREKLYTDFSGRWDSDNGKAKKRNKKKMMSTYPTGEQKEGNKGSFTQLSKQRKLSYGQSKTRTGQVEKRQEDYSYSKSKREARSLSVAQKLKELEMMDMSNVDHVLDIEEVLHYYSRLTCPAYLDIVDKFFMDVYTEFFGPPASPRSVNSRPKFRSVRA